MPVELCKDSNCNFVYPILQGDSIGNSLSTINLNFRQLDINLCNIEEEITNSFDVALNAFASLSGKWNSATTTLATNSACWNDTYTTVNQMSGFWLTPITLVYPYPFSSSTDIEIIRLWLNDNFSAKNGNCFNYIVGQQLYIFSPEYYFINRTASSNTSVGIKTVKWTATTSCISRKITINGSSKVDCGSVNSALVVEDQFINKFVGVRYTLDNTFEWSDGIKLFE